jgi:hypothetical protein
MIQLFYFVYSFLQDNLQLQKCDPISIVNSSKLPLRASDAVLDIGPFKVTLSDLCTTLQPETLCAPVAKQIKEKVPGFVPGWLADTVSTYIKINSKNCHISRGVGSIKILGGHRLLGAL